MPLPLAAMFVLGAASGVGANSITDRTEAGDRRIALCRLVPPTVFDDSPAGALVEVDSGCSPGEVGPVCGRAKHDARGRVTSFESQRCDSSLGSFLWFDLGWADVAVVAALAVFVLGLLWAGATFPHMSEAADVCPFLYAHLALVPSLDNIYCQGVPCGSWTMFECSLTLPPWKWRSIRSGPRSSTR